MQQVLGRVLPLPLIDSVSMLYSDKASEQVSVPMKYRLQCIAELVDHDDELFKKILNNPYHVFRNILPNEML